MHLMETGKVRPSMHSLRVITDRLAIPIDAVLIRPRGRRAGVDIKSEVLQQARARAQYARLRGGRGAAVATITIAHSILVAAYHILDQCVPYQDLGGDWFIRYQSLETMPAG